MTDYEKELYRIGRESNLSPEDRNAILNGAAEIGRLKFNYAESQNLLHAAWKREERWHRTVKTLISCKGGTDEA